MQSYIYTQNIVIGILLQSHHSDELIMMQCRFQGHGDVDCYLSCCSKNLFIHIHNKDQSL